MINSVHLLGHVGQAPQIKRTEKGQRYAILSLATSRRWKDKDTQARHDRTEWHRLVVWSEPLLDVVEKHVTTGAKLWIEGSLASREWTDRDGIKRYVTEVVLQGHQARLTLLDRKSGGVADPGGEDDYGHDKEPVYA
jgi:single-strand DNA-binding protein